jgi:hypothetical protein
MIGAPAHASSARIVRCRFRLRAMWSAGSVGAKARREASARTLRAEACRIAPMSSQVQRAFGVKVQTLPEGHSQKRTDVV